MISSDFGSFRHFNLPIARKTFQSLGRARHSVAVMVADLAKLMAQRSKTLISDAQRLKLFRRKATKNVRRKTVGEKSKQGARIKNSGVNKDRKTIH